METARAHLVLLGSIAVMNAHVGGMGIAANMNAHASKISQVVVVILMERVSAEPVTVERTVKRYHYYLTFASLQFIYIARFFQLEADLYETSTRPFKKLRNSSTLFKKN